MGRLWSRKPDYYKKDLEKLKTDVVPKTTETWSIGTALLNWLVVIAVSGIFSIGVFTTLTAPGGALTLNATANFTDYNITDVDFIFANNYSSRSDLGFVINGSTTAYFDDDDGSFVIDNEDPHIILFENDGTTNSTNWDISVDDGSITFSITDDSHSDHTHYFIINRTTMSVTRVDFPSGNVTVSSGNLGIGNVVKPKANVDIEGTLRIRNTTNGSCGAGNHGTLRYIINGSGKGEINICIQVSVGNYAWEIIKSS